MRLTAPRNIREMPIAPIPGYGTNLPDPGKHPGYGNWRRSRIRRISGNRHLEHSRIWVISGFEKYWWSRIISIDSEWFFISGKSIFLKSRMFWHCHRIWPYPGKGRIANPGWFYSLDHDNEQTASKWQWAGCEWDYSIDQAGINKEIDRMELKRSIRSN